MKKEVENWWKQAKVDLATAKDNVNIERFSYAIFLSEQAVEKALKSLYLKKFNEIPRIHDLTIFAKTLNLPLELYHDCEDLTNVYTETRYPDVSDIIPAERYTKEEANQFVKKAEEVIKWIKSKI